MPLLDSLLFDDDGMELFKSSLSLVIVVLSYTHPSGSFCHLCSLLPLLCCTFHCDYCSNDPLLLSVCCWGCTEALTFLDLRDAQLLGLEAAFLRTRVNVLHWGCVGMTSNCYRGVREYAEKFIWICYVIWLRGGQIFGGLRH